MTNTKLDILKSTLKDMGSVLIAYSGGVDSTFLVKVAHDVLGENTIAVTAQSETYSSKELKSATRLVKDIGIKHLIIETKELQYPHFSSNPINRCYYCKRELFTTLKEIAKRHGIPYVIEGTNADDLNDYRPGLEAINELRIRSPLKEVGLTKEEIREYSREMNLPTWDKPAIACLASRFPYGTTINEHKLDMVEKAENALLDLGIKQVRVRHHDNLARIEVSPSEIKGLMNENVRESIHQKLKEIGYTYVTLDLHGYRTGSMNEVLKVDK